MSRLIVVTGAPSPPRDDRIEEQVWTCNGRTVLPGTELSIRGERGRFRFHAHVLTASEESISVYGGPTNQQAWRSFLPARVKTVHRKAKARKT